MGPAVSIDPADTNVTRFQNFSLTCEGTGYPTPEILWVQNGSVIDLNQEHVSLLSLRGLEKTSSTLTISMADTSTSGLYHCTVSVEGLTVKSRSALILVQGEPSPSSSTHIIIIPCRSA